MAVSIEPLRVGIVGGGFIGSVVGEQFFNNADATVAALADPSKQARENIADRFSLQSDALYSEYEDMLATESLDAVLIGTPHTLHYEQIVTALDHGMHVLCDKPLTTDLDQAKDLFERTERSDRTVMVGYQRHLDSAFIAGRERFREWIPSFITAEIVQGWVSGNAGTWRLNHDLSGGGFLYDTGSHLLDVILWMSGLTPQSVAADMTFTDADSKIDERARLHLDFENGTTASISTLGTSTTHQEHIHVWDDDKTTYFESQQWQPTEVTEIDESAGIHHPHFDRSDQQNKADAFVASIRNDSEPPATVHDALRVTAVTEAAYTAARTGERVPIDY